MIGKVPVQNEYPETFKKYLAVKGAAAKRKADHFNQSDYSNIGDNGNVSPWVES